MPVAPPANPPWEEGEGEKGDGVAVYVLVLALLVVDGMPDVVVTVDGARVDVGAADEDVWPDKILVVVEEDAALQSKRWSALCCTRNCFTNFNRRKHGCRSNECTPFHHYLIN